MAIQKTDKIWHNGKLIAWDDAQLHLMSHVIHYGSSVFEGIRCYALPDGPAIFRAVEHIRRLIDSGKIYRMNCAFSLDEIVAGMVEIVAANGVWPCYIRPIMLRGYGDMGVNPLKLPLMSTLASILGENTWARKHSRVWTCAFPPGRGLRPTHCPPWPRPVPIT